MARVLSVRRLRSRFGSHFLLKMTTEMVAGVMLYLDVAGDGNKKYLKSVKKTGKFHIFHISVVATPYLSRRQNFYAITKLKCSGTAIKDPHKLL